LEIDKEYTVCITTFGNDVYWGKVVQATYSPTARRTCVAANVEDISCDYMESGRNNMTVASIEKSIKISEEILREKNERLQIERELFEMKKSKCEQNWTLQTMQFQFATILKRLDAISMPLTPAAADGCNLLPNLTSLPVEVDNSITPNMNPCSLPSTYQTSSQVLAGNPSLSVPIPNNLSLDPMAVQQLPPACSNQRGKFNVYTPVATEIMNPCSVHPSVGDFSEMYSSSVPLTTVPERPALPTSTLISVLRIRQFQLSDGEIPAMNDEDLNNNFQQREYNPKQISLRKMQYGEPPSYVLNGCYGARLEASSGIQQQALTKQYHQLENGLIDMGYAIQQVERGLESSERLNTGGSGSGCVLKEPISLCEEQEKTFYVNRSLDKNNYVLQKTERLHVPKMSHFRDAAVCDVLGVARSEDEDNQNVASFNAGSLSTVAFDRRILIGILKYTPYMPYTEVGEQAVYTVKRSDDDLSNQNWPLFFVQIQNEGLLDIINLYVDCATAAEPLPTEDIVRYFKYVQWSDKLVFIIYTSAKVGRLCVSYCHAFQAKLRAVITAIYDNDVEVHYIDYGNYEKVTYNDLHSINQLPTITRMHPAMAIPCLLSDLSDIHTDFNNCTQNDILRFMDTVSCEKPFFKLKFLRKRSDGVMIVQLMDSISKP
uniref:Tudor domain-containing protein n=1 Tax=Elaeophora elaphi TaxID=1147741 RepID=A0A0R3RIV6_9BILA